ncbi:unnamed protein product [Sphagnum tenellum]
MTSRGAVECGVAAICSLRPRIDPIAMPPKAKTPWQPVRTGSSTRWRLSAQRATATSLFDACSVSMKVEPASWLTAAQRKSASCATTSNTF